MSLVLIAVLLLIAVPVAHGETVAIEFNRVLLEECNVIEWHAEGYTGKDIKIAVLERENTTHGQQVANVLWQVAPEAEIVYRPRPGKSISGGEMCDESIENLRKFYEGLRDEGVDILTMSLGGSNTPEKERLIQEILIANGIYYFTSAGNTGGEIRSRSAAALEGTISVGAVDSAYLKRSSNEIRRASFSCYGEALDVYGFSGVYTTKGFVTCLETAERGGYFEGTSCANPWATGVFTLYLQWREERGLERPSYEAVRWLFDMNGKEVIFEGRGDDVIICKDAKLFVLPSIKEAKFSALNERIAQDKLELELGMREGVRSKEEILRVWNMTKTEASTSAYLFEGWFK